MALPPDIKKLNDLLDDLSEDPGSEVVYNYKYFLNTLPGQLQELLDQDGVNQAIRLTNVHYDVPDDLNSIRKQSIAKDGGQSYVIPIRGSFTLFRDGRPVETLRNKLIAHIPVPTRLGTFIVGGRDVTISNQLRLSPGIYTSRGEDGAIQAFVNSSTRQNMKFVFDPKGETFSMLIGGHKIPMYSVLSGLGVKPETIRKGWGDKIYNANLRSARQVDADLTKLHGVMHRFISVPLDPARRAANLRQALSDTTLDPWVTKVTTGKAQTALSPEYMMSVTSRMLDQSAGRIPFDDREALYFKEPYTIGRMILFALERNARAIKSKLTRRLDSRDDLNSIIARPLADVDGVILQKFNQDDLARSPEMTNPLGAMFHARELTLLGEGGIGTRHAITEETRGIHDSELGFVDALHSPEGDRIGVTNHLSSIAHIDDDKLKMLAYELGTGKMGGLTPRNAYEHVVALPGEFVMDEISGQLKPRAPKIAAIEKGRLVEVPARRATFVMAGSPSEIFDPGGAAVPFLGNDYGVRGNVAIKQMGQALPLLNREAPLVQNLIGKTDTGDARIYQMINTKVPRSIKQARVARVGSDTITLETPDGARHQIEFYNNYQLNSDAKIDSTPRVKAGDVVYAGDILTENNFSNNRALSLGTNLDIVYMPYKGLNFADGLVISETAAKKLTSAHSYQEAHDIKKNDILSKKQFQNNYPKAYTKEMLDKLDDDGVALVGQTIMPGEPFLLKLSPRKLTDDDLVRGRISSAFKSTLARDEKVWDGDSPAVVRKVVRKPDGIFVYLSTEEPATQGDKISGRHGQKGVITMVVPDAELPHYEDGTVPDVIQNIAAVPSRMNLGQLLEVAAGNVAKATGRPYYTRNFTSDNDLENVLTQMKALGISGKRMLIDPDGTPLGEVYSGPQYFYKLVQQADKYYKARNRHDPYDIASHRPVKGPKLDPLGFYALLAHGVPSIMKEMGGFASEMNDDFWRDLETGKTPTPPQTTFAYDKMQAMLKAAGINVLQQDNSLKLMPMTDKDTLALSSGKVPDASMGVRIGKIGPSGALTPYEGGLYDHNLFGGLTGDRWGHIELPGPMPSPTYENAIRSVAGLTGAEYTGLIRGSKMVQDGKVVDITPEGIQAGLPTRGEGFVALLGGIDPAAELARAKGEFPAATGDTRDKLIRKMRYLRGLTEAGLKPVDYLIRNVPVLPPVFRPVYLNEVRNEIRVSDLTSLYQDVGKLADVISRSQSLPRSVTGDAHEALYDAVKAAYGVGTATNYDGNPVKGVLQFLKGDRPIEGHFQAKIFSKRQTLGGQATIMPDPKLDIDEIGLPEEMAWTMMEPFVMRKLTQSGIDASSATQMIKDRHPMAAKNLDAVLEERPVMLSRDPKLHKFNYLAFKAHRVPGRAIYIPPLIVKGFNADFDGDRMNVYVPIQPDAVKEAWERMTPSSNLFKYGPDQVIMTPEEDAILGMYAGTRLGVMRDDQRFDKPRDIVAAYTRGDLKLTDGVKLGEQVTTPGRVMLNLQLPEQIRDYSKTYDANEIKATLQKVAETMPQRYGDVLKAMKDSGDEYGYRMALSFSLEDFLPMRNKSAIDRFQSVSDTTGSGARDWRNEWTPELSAKIQSQVQKHVNPESALAMLANSGAKGSWGNVMQMVYSPVAMQTTTGDVAPYVIKHGYAEGMTLPEYWTAAKGARAGIQSKSVETSAPGYFSKGLVRASLGMTVQQGDKMPEEGLSYPVEERSLPGRYLAKPVVDSAGNELARANDLITPELIQTMKRLRIKEVEVRSPLTSAAARGIYAKDFGRLPGNQTPRTGMDLGVISAHSLTEPAVQVTLKQFHSGGASGQAKTIRGLYAVWPLMEGRVPSSMKAVMSPVGGRITSITKDKSGAHEVTVEGGGEITRISTTPGMPLLVKEGDAVKPGHQLQDGMLDPQDILKYQGMMPLRRYMVDQIEQNFGKYAPNKKYIEAVVANLTRYAKIDDPGESDFLPGDVMTVNELEAWNKRFKKDAKKFAGVTYAPIFPGMSRQIVEGEPDFAVRMLGEDLARQLPEMAAQGATARLSGTRPVLPFIANRDYGRWLNTQGDY